MDMTNFTFSEDEESLQSRTLRDNIQRISRQLSMNSSNNSTAMSAGIAHDYHSPHPPAGTPEMAQLNQRTPTFPWNASFVFIPSLPHTPLTPLSSCTPRVRPQTPILTPPSRFRDVSNNSMEEQNEPFDLSTDSALDLRVQPLELNVKKEVTNAEPEVEEPLDLVKPKEESRLSDISIQTDVSQDASITANRRNVTYLDETVYYPRPDAVANEECEIKEENTLTTSKQTSTKDLGHVESNATTGKSCREIAKNWNRATGLDVIRQSYMPSVDDNSDKTSTTVIIDDAFQYLEDINDETNFAVSKSSQNHPDLNQTYETNPTILDRQNNLNQTFDIISPPVLTKKPPSGRSEKRIHIENKDTAQADINVDDETSSEEKEEDSLSLLDSSSFTSVTNILSDAATSIWSVKEATTSSTSNLTLTLTKTPATYASPPFRVDSTKTPPQDNLSSTPNSRIVIGSNNSIEESTIVKEASQVMPSSVNSTCLSYPATPDVSLSQSSHHISHKGCSTSNDKVLSSTPRKIRREPIGDEKPKEESLRTQVLKQSMSTKTVTTESESVLNIAFNQNNKKPTPVKRKKKSLFTALKRQFLCNNAANASQLSLHNQTGTATCMGRINTHHKKKSVSSKLIPKCSENISSASISFVTLDRSSYSSPMPAWCRQILSTTESTSTPKPISSPKISQNPKYSKTKSVGISTSSLPNPYVSMEQLQPNTKIDTGISWLSQIDSYHSPSTSTRSVSTTTQEKSHDKKHTSSSAGPKPETTENLTASSPPITHNPKSSSPSSSQADTSNTLASPVKFDTLQVKHVRNWMALSPYNTQIDLIARVGRSTAEWLFTFVSDTHTKRLQSRFNIQPNRNVLLELCYMCNIKVKASVVDPDLLLLTKNSSSRAPTETDLKRLIRGTRR